MTLALTLFLLGLASGVHCVGMCGGFIAAFAGRRVIPIRNESARPCGRLAVFNAGRITSYSIAGAIAGALGGALTAMLGAQQVLYVVANVLLVAIGLHLAGASRVLAPLEALAAPLWRRLQPLAAKAMNRGAFAAGLLGAGCPAAWCTARSASLPSPAARSMVRLRWRPTASARCPG
jgi:sulfite exporter TauE/SafE